MTNGQGKGKELTQQNQIIKGLSANKGIARGVVRIITDPHKYSHFDQGDILVAENINPNYLHLMHKCAAIITDKGGILSLAAIIARELKKPCIIGTKNASKILHDGDEVEVNAERGEIRII